MAHRTQLYLDEIQYQYLKTLSQKEGKSIAQIIRDWIEDRRNKKDLKKVKNDPFLKLRGHFKSGHPDMAAKFDDYLYGDAK
ncbi:MAG: hypothetical protein ACD_73C00139G0003 [uncultured bacterium]|nr:MAG: hypothetical protein ACD_73C00139G0003 [uncultured bacterium]